MLFGTENMPSHGDWKAEVLLLAQDCGIVKHLIERIRIRHPCPHGYGESVQTNAKLSSLQRIAPLPTPVLYGSVVGSLWRRGENKTGAPPAWNEVLPSYCVPMVRWVVTTMTNVRAIACLGPYSWIGVMSAANRTYRFKKDGFEEHREFRDGEKWIDVDVPSYPPTAHGSRRVRVFAMWHPGARVSYDLLAMNRANLSKYIRNGAPAVQR